MPGAFVYFFDTWMGEPFNSDAKRQVCEVAIKPTHKLHVKQHVNKLAGAILGKRPMITDKGNAGWVPEDAKVGDTIAVLRGAETPFVLRKREESNTEAGMEMAEYTLVGEAYLGQTMYGEALRDLEESNLHEQIFCIR